MNLTVILIIISLVAGGIGVGGIKGCLMERDAKITAQQESKRLQILQESILQAAENQKEVRRLYEKEKSRLDSLSGNDLDTELDELLSEMPPATKPKKPGTQ